MQGSYFADVIRIAKVILAATCAIAVVVIVALVGVNLYLQSDDVQQRIRVATQDALGAPVQVKRTLYTPWSGLTLSGLSVSPYEKPSPNLLEAAEFSVRFELLPLLERRLVIGQINLSEPILALRQRADGKWAIRPPAPPQVIVSVDVPPQTSDLPPASPPIPSPQASPGISIRESPRQPDYVVELKKMGIRNGKVLFSNDRGRPIAVGSEISVTAQMRSPANAEGTFRVGKMEFYEAIKPTSLVGKFSMIDGVLTISEISCDLAQGKITGQINVQFPPQNEPRFVVSAEATGVSIPRLLEEATGESVGASGKVAARIHVEGNPRDAETITGNGKVYLNAARLQPMDFIRQIGSLLRVDELQMLDLEQAESEFSIRDKRVNIEHFVLKSDNLVIKGSGPIGFDGKLDIDARLLLNEKLQRQLRGVLLRENFTASEDADYEQVTFDISGKMSRPKTNLVERMTGIEIGSFGGLIRGFLQPPKKSSQPDDAN